MIQQKHTTCISTFEIISHFKQANEKGNQTKLLLKIKNFDFKQLKISKNETINSMNMLTMGY